MTTQAPDLSQLGPQLAAMAQPFVQQAAAAVGQAAQPAVQQAGRDFGKGASEGAQWSNGTIAAVGVGAVAVLGLVGYAAYVSGQRKPAFASYGYAELDLHGLGMKMMNWHSGQWDPVYMVASYFVDGKDYPDLDVVSRARTSLYRLLSKISAKHGVKYGMGDSEEELELDEILSALSSYLENHDTGSFASADDAEPPTLRPLPRVIIDDEPVTQRFSLANTQRMPVASSMSKTLVKSRRHGDVMEHRMPTPERPYYQARPLKYEGMPWPEEPGRRDWRYQVPVHDRLTQRVPGLAHEEGMSPGAMAALGVAAVAVGGIAIGALVVAYGKHVSD